MEQLTLNGEKLPQRSTIGWVYWGRLSHTARRHLRPASDAGRLVGMTACRALVECGALANMHALVNTSSAERSENTAHSDTGGQPESAPPGPLLARLQQILRFAGIDAVLERDRVSFCFTHADGITLAHPVPHPWCREHEIKSIGQLESLPDSERLGDLYDSVLEANRRLERMLSSDAPAALIGPAQDQLQSRVCDLFDELIEPEDLLFSTRTRYGGTAVLAPGPELNWDQLGVPDEIAWSLYGRQVALALNDPSAAEQRTREAAKKLDEIMANSWVLLYSGKEMLFDTPEELALHRLRQDPPTHTLPPAPLLAFHPVRQPDPVIRIHTSVCSLMDQDFDGNEAGVLLPLSEEAQTEAAQRLSLEGRLKRDPGLFDYVISNYQGSVWGLARLNFGEEGKRELSELVGEDVSEDLLTKAYLDDLLKRTFVRDGVESALDLCDRLMQRGFTVCRESGASFNPFIGADMDLPSPPKSEDSDEWKLYRDEVEAALLTQADFTDNDLGPVVLLNRTGARGTRRQLGHYVGAQGPLFYRPDGSLYVIRHNFREGLDADELLNRTPGALWGLAATNLRWIREQENSIDSPLPLFDDVHVLGRALRSPIPGVVFARAAAFGEIDPLDDPVARIFVGLVPRSA